MFEWDEEKSQKNLVARGLSFDDAARVFSGPCVTFEDTRNDYGEPRFITLGQLGGARRCCRAHPTRRKHADHLDAKGK